MSAKAHCTLDPASFARLRRHVPLSFTLMSWCLAVSLCGLLPAGEPGADARALLEKAQAACQNRPGVVFDQETVISPYDGKMTPAGFLGERYLMSFRQDGERIDLVRRRLQRSKEGEVTMESRDIWDGKMFLHRDRVVLPEVKPNASFSFDASARRANDIIRGNMGSGYVDGFFPNSRDHYTTIMLRSENLTVHERPEEIAGHPCRVVEGDTEKGHYQAWIDVNCGYQLRQIEIQQANEFLFTMKDVTLEQIDGVWVPTRGTSRERVFYPNGAKDDLRCEMVRRNVTFKPDFNKIGAFQMDLPEGTRLINYQDRKTRYVWHNNKPEEVRKVHDQLVGRQAPLLVVEQWYNTASQPPDLTGKVVLLDFFGVWCRPCMAQIPHIKGLWEKYASQGLVVIGVHTPLEKEGIAAFLARDQVSYPIAVDLEGKTAQAYTVFFYPTIVVLDRQGQVRAINPPEEQLADLLESLLKPQS
jgi:thiol-disulfide isomerase/thioredoxin